MSELWTTKKARERHPLLAFFARRPITVIVLLVATTLLGVISGARMPLELFPGGLERRSLNVSVPYTRGGDTVSPFVVEREVTLPVEAELSTIPGLEEITATSSSTDASFRLQFDRNRNMNDAYAEVMAAMERARLRLPSDVGQIRVRRWRGDSNAVPLAFINFSWDENTPDPHVTIEHVIQPYLESIDGVASANFFGGHRKFIAVDLDPEKTRAYSVDLGELLQRLRGDNFRAPAGRVTVEEGAGPGQTRSRDVYLVADSRFLGIEEIENTPVRPGLAVADITRHGLLGGVPHRGVYETYSVSNYVRVNRQGGATVMLHKAGDANTVEVGGNLTEALTRLERMPQMRGFSYRVRWNQADDIKESIATLMETLMWGGLLALLVLVLFLKSWRLALVIALSIPLAMTLTLGVMYLAGQTINLLVLMGFTLAAGMLLDNSIVVAENVYRRHSLGEAPEAAGVRGAGEVGLALLLATSTTVIVFVTVIYVSGDEQISFFMSKLGLPIGLSLGFSILLAIGVIPMTMSHAGLLRPDRPSRLRVWFARQGRQLRVMRRRGPPLKAWPLTGLWQAVALFVGRNASGLPDTPFVDRLRRYYMGTVRWLVKARYPALAIGVGSSIWLASWLYQAQERTDQAQGNEQRLMISASFASASDVMLRRHAFQIVEIEPGSAADRVGLLPGDFILRYNMRPITSPDDLRHAEARAPAGVPVSVDVARGRLSGRLEAAGGPLGVIGRMEDTEPLREAVWSDWVLAVEDTLLGRNDAVERRRQAVERDGMSAEQARLTFGRTREEAAEEFGIETLTVRFGSSSAMLWIDLDRARVAESREIYRRIMDALPERSGVRIWGEFQSSSVSEVSVRLTGPDTDRLLSLAEDVAVRLSDVPGLEGMRVDASESLDQLSVGIDRQRAAALGVEPMTFTQILGFQLGGTMLRDFHRDEAMLPLRVRFAPPEDASGNPRDPGLQDVEETRVATGGGGSVAARAVTRTTGMAEAGIGDIRRRNRQTTVRVVGTTSSDDLDRIQAQVRMAMAGMNFPPGYSQELGGRFASFASAQEDVGRSFLWAAVLVFLVMCFLFESFLRPVAVLISSIPGAVIGGYALLAVTGTPADEMTILGLLVLVGVVVNNGIVLVDLINRLRVEGMGRLEAVLQGCGQRMRPILLTTLTTAFGLLPMAVGSSTFVGTPYYPMGRMVLGGIVVSMLYTLLLLPVAYLVLDDVGETVKGWGRVAFARKA